MRRRATCSPGGGPECCWWRAAPTRSSPWRRDPRGGRAGTGVPGRRRRHRCRGRAAGAGAGRSRRSRRDRQQRRAGPVPVHRRDRTGRAHRDDGRPLSRRLLRDPGVHRRHAGGRSGWIVNVNTPAAFAPWPGALGYASARWAVRGFTEALRVDLHGTDIGVSQVVPGKVSSAYFDHNPGAESRIPRIGKLIRTLTPEQAGEAIADAVEQRGRGCVRALRAAGDDAPGAADAGSDAPADDPDRITAPAGMTETTFEALEGLVPVEEAPEPRLACASA
ncbi:MAG TPA: SDR family NAD(P)-dependent oxidoreductase [Solirubrobacteraceae bacterium]|nr:SDR family NAD(P)-dependent oxidoreductase [Solirubrobacteraceae bacterium]